MFKQLRQLRFRAPLPLKGFRPSYRKQSAPSKKYASKPSNQKRCLQISQGKGVRWLFARLLQIAILIRPGLKPTSASTGRTAKAVLFFGNTTVRGLVSHQDQMNTLRQSLPSGDA